MHSYKLGERHQSIFVCNYATIWNGKWGSAMAVNCFKCRHFFTTWDASNPRGCKAYGFKTKELPSTLVKRTSGMDCLKFEPKQAEGHKR